MDWMGAAERFRWILLAFCYILDLKLVSSEFRDMFNYHLAKMRKSGILSRIEMKWLSPDRPQPPQDLNQVADALGGNQVFFPFSILLGGIIGSVAFMAFEKIKFLCKRLVKKY